ncbi:LON peptidase substrate-binding domain-containing protein [Williamwhitmania taraxaci]|uniref:Lon N-terminal domain-containing protein n=1 Tax=Williamwhitmania taraxaci TaxID=1640674 RepID=A0A1G6HK21_9BACT|nr:LON peptidase substrate-binding domain-containing protein [Williamwhitmania taraxaci]SDB94541.1 hypothetical protein SAMN05216323_101173 [Williamwhitmania taraxaci]
MVSKSKQLALFPLPSFVFPQEELPLRIFETRYKELINDVKDTGMTFGIPFISADGLTQLGTEVRLEKVLAENNKGEMVIMIKGIRIFEVLSFSNRLPGKLYGGGQVIDWEVDHETNNPDIMVLVKQLGLNFNGIYGSLSTMEKVDIYDIANKIYLSPEEKFHLVSIDGIGRKESFLYKMLQFQALIKNQEEKLRSNFSLN